MKAVGFIQVVPERDADGRARHLRMTQVTQRHPRIPAEGAITVRVVLDIPEELANAQTAEAAVEAGAVTITLPALEAEPV